jgi:hypothetical protein
MPSNHTVQQGEHLSSIASQYGFTDYTVIWNHAQNAQLKTQRGNPNVLLAGDSLYIPDKQQKQESGATTARHKFVLNQKRLMLRLTLEDLYENPLANAACALVVDGKQFQLTSGSDGKLEQPIDPAAQSCILTISGDGTPFAQRPITVKIGDLDPVDAQSGQRARLNNLGYLPGTSDDDPDDPQFCSAVEQFQCDQKLTVDGKIGQETQSKLKAVHGC